MSANRPKGSEDPDSSSGPDKGSLADVYRELSPYLNISYTFLIAILLFAYLGDYLDGVYGTAPNLKAAGALLGVVVGFYSFFKVALKSSEKGTK